MTIFEEIQSLSDKFLSFDDELDKYEYIIELGKQLPDIDNKYKNEESSIKGCQSQVWLHVFEKEGKINFQAYSKTLITKGLIHILMRIFSNRSSKEILKSNPSNLEVLGLNEIVSVGRQNGIATILEKIYEFAKKRDNIN